MPGQNVDIPARSSSRVPRQEELDLEKEINGIGKDIEKMTRTKLHPNPSFGEEYWAAATEVADNMEKKYRLKWKLSVLQFAEKRDRLARSHSKGELAYSLALTLRRAFMEHSMPSRIGLGLPGARGARDPKAQLNFRGDLITAYGSEPPGNPHSVWCPITGAWINSEYAVAAHLYSRKHGQNSMDAIFGTMDEPELYSPRNGLLIDGVFESRFDCGLMAIVPDIDDTTSIDQVAKWLASDPKNYKLQIVDKQLSRANDYHHSLSTTIGSLDGRKLKFRNDFRPRARYLYFHYCVQILRVAFKERFQGMVLRERELNKPIWATPERYIKANMLYAFVEELGQEYKPLFPLETNMTADNKVEGDEGSDDLLLANTARQIH